MTVTLVEDLCYLVHSEQVDVPADIKWSATASILDGLFMSARKHQNFRFTCKFQYMQSKIWSMPMLPGSLRKILQCYLVHLKHGKKLSNQNNFQMDDMA
jgi:hypothetical protein